MAVDRIDDFVDLQATGAQKSALLGQINEVYTALKKVSELKINFEGGSSLKDSAKLLSDIAAAQTKLDTATTTLRSTQAAAVKETRTSTAAYEAIADAAARASATTDQFSDTLRDSVLDVVRVKKELAAVKAEIKEYEKAATGATGVTAKSSEAYQDLLTDQALLTETLRQNTVVLKQNAREMVAAPGSVDEFTATLDRLQRAYKGLSAEQRASDDGSAMLAAIQELDPAVKGFNESLGNFQRSVGNYEKGASNFSGALRILSSEFDNVKKQLSEHEAATNKDAQAIDALKKQYEILQSLLTAQETGFATATAELRSNETALRRLEAAGQKNTEVYQTLLSETAKLKGGVADLQREIRSLASTTSDLDGLIQGAQALAGIYGVAQGAAALFGTENEDLQKTFVKLQAVMTVLNGLQAIQTALRKGSSLQLLIERGLLASTNAQLALNSAATSKNIVLKYAAIAAQKALNTVIGAGNPYIKAALIVIGLLAAAYAVFAGAQKEVTANFKQLNEQIAASNVFLESNLSAIKNNNAERIASLQSAFAEEAALRAENVRGLREEADAIAANLTKNRTAYDAAVSTIRRLTTGRKKLNDEDRATLEEAGKMYDGFEQQSQQHADLMSKIRVQELNDLRSTTEETIKVEQNRIQILISNSNTLSNLYKKQSDDVTSSYDARLAAANKFAAEQKRISALELQSALKDPTLNPSARAVIMNAANKKVIDIERAQAETMLKLRKEQSNRIREAEFNNEVSIREMRLRAFEATAANEKKGFNIRLQALIDAGNTRLEAVRAEGAKLLENDLLISSERIAIEQETQNQLNAVMLENAATQRAMLEENANRIKESYAIATASRSAALASAQAAEIVALNELQNEGVLSAEKYAKLRADIERKYAGLTIQNEVNAAFARTQIYKEGTQERADAEKELAALVIQLSDNVADQQREKLDGLAAGISKIIKTVNDVTGVMGGFLDASIIRNKNAIADTLKAAENAHNLELAFIEASTASQEEKAARTIVAEAKINAARQQAEEKQKQQDQRKAQFDKANTIAQIILNTALAVVKALPNVPLAIGIGALGAAQLGVAIATPIPRYATGTDNHPGGAFIAGDGGRPEVVIEPGKKPFITPAKSTTYFGAPGTKVIPSIDEYNASLGSAAYGSIPNIENKPIDENRLAALMLKGYDRVANTIKNKQETHFSWSNGELKKSIKNGSSWTNYVNNL